MGDTTKIVIVDDDRPSVAVLENGLKDFPDVRVVATAHTCEEARLAILKHRPQLLFLDIELPGGVNGLDFLSELVPSVDWEMRTTFYTSYDKYLLQALRLHAFDFLLKPIRYQKFQKAVEKAQQWFERPATFEPEAESMFIRQDSMLRQIDFSRILYVCGMKDYVNIYLEGEKRPLVTHLTMKAVEAQLPPHRFMRVHRSYIVSIPHINSIEHRRIQIGQSLIPISNSYLPTLMNVLSVQE